MDELDKLIILLIFFVAAILQVILPYLCFNSIEKAAKDIIEAGNELNNNLLNEAGKKIKYGASQMILLFGINLVLGVIFTVIGFYYFR